MSVTSYLWFHITHIPRCNYIEVQVYLLLSVICSVPIIRTVRIRYEKIDSFKLPKLKLAGFGQNKSLNDRDESRYCVVELFSMTKGETSHALPCSVPIISLDSTTCNH
jgi:hypothetical protein